MVRLVYDDSLSAYNASLYILSRRVSQKSNAISDIYEYSEHARSLLIWRILEDPMHLP